jgi:hypothetical protein
VTYDFNTSDSRVPAPPPTYLPVYVKAPKGSFQDKTILSIGLNYFSNEKETQAYSPASSPGSGGWCLRPNRYHKGTFWPDGRRQCKIDG